MDMFYVLIAIAMKDASYMIPHTLLHPGFITLRLVMVHIYLLILVLPHVGSLLTVPRKGYLVS